jgi:hypothetical protein
MNVYLPPVIENRPLVMYHDFLSRGFWDIGATVIIDPNVPAPHPVMAVDIEQDGARRRAWWDYADFADINRDLVGAAPYFKIELRQADSGPGIYPIGQVVPNILLDARHSLLATPRKFADDVYAVMRVTNFDDRRRCIEAIRREKWHSVCGLAGRRERPEVPNRLGMKKFPQLDNYRYQRRSRVCVAAPGIGEKTWRHMETLALGVCLVCAESDCVWPAPTDGCLVTCRRDWSDLAKKVWPLLQCSRKREEIAAAGRAYWERWCSPAATARLIVEKTMEATET